MKAYHILYTTSQKYFPHMLTSIYSLLESNKDSEFIIHIIESDFAREEKNQLDRLIELYPNNSLIFYDVNDFDNIVDLYNVPKWHGSNISNAKLLASEILDDVDKVLYLDSDTLVVHSIKEILDKKTNYPISAVREATVPKYMRNFMDCYFNSGVLLFNFEKFYKEECIGQLYSTLKNTNIPLLYPAQDLLNLSLYNRIGNLELSYNVTPYIHDLSKHRILLEKYCNDYDSFYSSQEIKEAVDNPYILHHLAYLNTRAWDDNRIHPFRKEYQYYRNLWDQDFQKDKNENILSKFPLLPYFNLVADSILSDNTYEKIKKKVK